MTTAATFPVTPSVDPSVDPSVARSIAECIAHPVAHAAADSTWGEGLPAAAPVLTRLQHEWDHLTLRRRELARVRSWNLPGAPTASLDDLLRRTGFRVYTGGTYTTAEDTERAAADADALLLHLVGLARDETLAARIVLQRILPPLCAVARRHSESRHQRHALLDELLANAWTVIRTFPTARRPDRVASGLVRDITFATIVRPSRRMSSAEVPTTDERLTQVPAWAQLEPLDELVELLDAACAANSISSEELDLICQLVTFGRPEELAIVRRVTPRTVRNQRDAIVYRLRQYALANAA